MPVQGERQTARLIAGDVGAALVPDDHRAAAPALSLVHALEVAGRQVVICHRHGETADPGIERRALGHRPRAQDLAYLDPQVEMQCRRVMKLHDEPGRRHALDGTAPRPAPGAALGPPRTLTRDGPDPAKGNR